MGIHVKKYNMNIRSALLMSAATAAAIGLSLTSTSAASDTMETVVVTGSRIASTDAMSASPLTVITTDSITKSKTVSLDQALNKLPEVSQVSADQNSISPGGAATVDLRGLGSNRTLILINGERMVSTFANGGQAQDMAGVPMGMIDHVEVLKDGASPIYGADAISGVINVITKTDFTGAQLNVGGGISNHGDHATKQFSGTFGVASDKGNIIASLDYYTEDPVRQSARSWAHGTYTSSSYVPQGQYAYADDTGVTHYLSGNDDGSLTSESGRSHFNTGMNPYLIQARSVINATVNANYKVNENLTLFVESYFTNRKAAADLNAEPVGAATTAKWQDGLILPSTNPNNTTGEDLTIYKRLTEVGDRYFTDNVNTFQERVGAKGNLFGWTWQAGYIYGQSDSSDNERNAINLTKLQELVGNATCETGAPSNCGSVTLSGTSSLTAEDISYISYTSSSSSHYVQQIAYGDISGELPITLPGGKVGLAAGIDYRSEYVKSIPDAIAQMGDAAESNSQVTQGGYNVKEIYGEVRLPVLKNAPYAQELSFDFAGRFSHYSSSGDGTVYKGSVNWAVNDTVRFRGSYGTGERAPQVGSEMFLGNSTSADAYTDPCESPSNATVIANCTTSFSKAGLTYNKGAFSQTTPQLTATLSGNANLKPEKSVQYNLGVVLTPDFLVPNLSITVDYYNIHLNDMIGTVDANTALSMCYKSDGYSSPYCSYFARSSSGQISSYSEPYVNLGWAHTDGIDYGVNYATEDLAPFIGLPDGTLFNFGLKVSWLNKFREQNADGSVTEYAGKWVDNASSYANPKWKGNFDLGITLPSGTSFDITERFIGAQSYYDAEYRSDPDMHVPALLYTDLSFTLPWDNYSATVGIDNVFDKDPPLVEDTYVQTVSNQYDMVGRYFYLKLSAKL